MMRPLANSRKPQNAHEKSSCPPPMPMQRAQQNKRFHLILIPANRRPALKPLVLSTRRIPAHRRRLAPARMSLNPETAQPPVTVSRTAGMDVRLSAIPCGCVSGVDKSSLRFEKRCS